MHGFFIFKKDTVCTVFLKQSIEEVLIACIKKLINIIAYEYKIGLITSIINI